jgi:hypothetical protein
MLGGHCFILNVHAPTEDKTDDMQVNFYKELECVFDKFPTYLMEILLGNFTAKVGREDFFKPTIGSKSLHKISNDNVVRVANFATSIFPHCNIRKFTWKFPEGKTAKLTIF